MPRSFSTVNSGLSPGTVYNQMEDSGEVWSSSDGRHWELAADFPGFKAIDSVYRAAVYQGQDLGRVLWRQRRPPSGRARTRKNLAGNQTRPNPLKMKCKGLVVYHNELYLIVYGNILKLEKASGWMTD